jgi:pilus assembly protein FimV
MGAYALGVGDIKLHSALNQNLNAEIALVLSDTEKLTDIKVKLAPPSKFEEAGVPWSHFLSQIKFKTVTKANGAVIVKLSSTEVLNEPFLDFLLEVSWPKGDIYREFTVLVDPPAIYQQKTVPVTIKQPEPIKQQQLPTQKVFQQQPIDATAMTRSSTSEYGPTGSRDTLWKVAEKVIRNKDISVEQMMMALYEANPEAFFKQNVNALSAGAILKVPEDDVVMKLSPSQAKQEFYKQVDAWRGRVTKASTTVQQVAVTPEINSQLELKAPTTAEIDDRVQVTPSVNEKVQDDATTFVNDSLALENQELKNRLNKLEQKLANLQKTLAVDDEQLATLQSEELKSDAEQVPDKSVVVPAKVEKSEQTKKVVTPKPQPAPKPVVQPESETGIYNILMGTAGLGALGLFGWLWWRKRKVEDQINSESMFAASSQISLPETDKDLVVPVVEVNQDSSYDVGTVGESSFLSEFTPSDLDAFETDQAEIDPIAEADVYLAYGRYQQAEELMRQAIESQPGRDECKLKLFEIFYASENKKEFEAFAEELISTGKNKDTDFWTKVSEMGSELCPDSKLFIPGAIVGGVEKATTAETDISEDEILQPDFSALESEANPEQSDLDEGLEFNIDSLDDAKVQGDSDTLNISGENDSNGIDFDLGTIDSPEAESKKDNVIEEPEAFDLSDDPFVEASQEQLANLDFNADTEEKNIETPNLSGEGSLELESSLDDFNFELDESKAPAAPAPVEDLISDSAVVSDLTDMDELETKIDLAKAYIDMGDSDAAKTIAEEVLEKGSKTQKEEAKEIINQL